MYKRLVILSLIIIAALCGLVWMGYRSIEIRAQGMEGSRLGEFAEVAEQVRRDVTRKLDEFVRTEQERPYTDYQYYYVPEDVTPTQRVTLLRSPLGDSLDNDFAYGNFQIEPDGSIVTPYYLPGQTQENQQGGLVQEAENNINNIRLNLMPVLGRSADITKFDEKLAAKDIDVGQRDEISPAETKGKAASQGRQTKGQSARAGEYQIESLRAESQKEQVLKQIRSVVASNTARSQELLEQQKAFDESQSQMARQDADRLNQQMTDLLDMEQSLQPEVQADVVEIRIEPFVPLVVPDEDVQQSIFGGQVFMLRHVQIEDRHLLQGFQLNENKLIEQVKESASRLMREGMRFELPQVEEQEITSKDIAYKATLNFGFGDLILNLKEIDPAWIGKEIKDLKFWYISIISVVFVAVALGLSGLWVSSAKQIKLAQKKDDFISAVSHELRTPLTSIRMYSEMLEKNWVKSDDKLSEYYGSMRQESERLSRLIENVLDFSRIQKGRKRYTFKAGDINKCVTDIVELMKPYAAQNGFSIIAELGEIGQTIFDSDAVAQIVINLLDNAVKYARDAEDKTITVRTKSRDEFIIIEVEDHGPGVPHRQRKKIFEQFYRIGVESTRETAGTGLGLALVKKFAQAHNGFVEILSAKPTGSIFRVALAART
ncbi:MAG: HAMP domain-containing sensor histidine kinase [Phycisphaerales bacterium]|jgi:signal transduction histidine kinase